MVSCRLSATSIRFSDHPSPAREMGLPHGRLTRHHQRRDPVGVTTFHTHEKRPGRVPPIPRGRRCSPGPDAVPGQRLPHHNGLSLHPAGTSHRAGPLFTRHQRRFTLFTRPVCPSPVTPMVGQGSFGFPLGLRTPPLPAAHAKGGARHRARARDYTTDITSALLTASPLAECDIVSQRQMNAPAELRLTSTRTAPHEPFPGYNSSAQRMEPYRAES